PARPGTGGGRAAVCRPPRGRLQSGGPGPSAGTPGAITNGLSRRGRRDVKLSVGRRARPRQRQGRSPNGTLHLPRRPTELVARNHLMPPRSGAAPGSALLRARSGSAQYTCLWPRASHTATNRSPSARGGPARPRNPFAFVALLVPPPVPPGGGGLSPLWGGITSFNLRSPPSPPAAPRRAPTAAPCDD